MNVHPSIGYMDFMMSVTIYYEYRISSWYFLHVCYLSISLQIKLYFR